MPTAERSIGIRRPAEQVFRFLADGRTATQWRSGELSILGLEQASRIAFRTTVRGFGVDGAFALEAMGDATILTCTLRAEPSGWRALLLAGAARSVLAAELAALDELQDLLER